MSEASLENLQDLLDPTDQFWAELTQLLGSQKIVRPERNDLADRRRSAERVEDQINFRVTIPHSPVDRQVPLILGFRGVERNPCHSASTRSHKRSSATSRTVLNTFQSA